MLQAFVAHPTDALLALVLLIAALIAAAALPRLRAGPAIVCSGALAALLCGLACWLPLPSGLALLPAAAALLGGALARSAMAAAPGHRRAVPVPPIPMPRTPMPPPPPSLPLANPAPDPALGTLGRYRIDRQIARGAMGTVYLGHDPKIGRQVAVKTLALSQEFAGEALEEARSRFFREAETAGRLQHRDIVTIFDVGEDQDLAYIAMEYVAGHDLQRHAAPGRQLPVGDVLAIVARVAEALAHAHSQGVVHRDIKPANVMIEPKSDTVKVTDFGIARVTDASRTRTGMVLGTPSFMSPEQLAGRRVDGRSDLYSLGVMLFQLLTGALPHQSESMAKLMFQIANETAPDVRTLRPDLPEALANVVALALEKRPEVRYADGHQLAADLRAVAALLLPTADAEPAAPITPPEASGFEATVRFSPGDPGHNSGP